MTCANVRHNGGEAHTKRMRPSTAVVAHRAHHTRRRSDSRCALPLSPPSFPSCLRRKQQPPATASRRYKRSIQIHCNVHRVCMWLCVPADTRGKEVKTGAEHVKRRTNKTVQRRCMAEVKRKRPLKLMILHRRESSGHSLKINENNKKNSSSPFHPITI
ncbi:hypothetical protein TCDM_10877 [Trypanosoma cruzi Dm28c]|uniref:Uncharacterized protein n=1 Tax=Trypanosoma cruzi Dm28c TaxID=1416333 RepID=V5D279_TRYCR|nr:hypothetical protein TCDM_10877 [Trypanosoma cruzi Dm28c]